MLILLLSIIFSINNGISVAYASSTDTYFARIMYDNVYLYKTPVDIDEYSNIYFTLPKTYFVELIADSSSDFYQAKYLNFTGYVKKEEVQTIIGTPITPYLENISFRVYSEQSCFMRTEPTSQAGSSSLVIYLPLLSRDITYIGTIKGECLIDGRTDIWYYCKYTADKEYYGYVYSDFCDKMTTIVDNTEEVEYTTNPDFSTPPADTSLEISDKTTGIVIGILCIPAIVFVFMILKGAKILNKEKRETKEVIDY